MALDKTILADYTVEVIQMAHSKAMYCLEQSAKVVMDKARPLCAIKTGDMLASLTTAKDDPLSISIGYTVPYAFWVESGTGPHTIRVKDKKIMYNKEQDQFYGTVVQHPGAVAHPSLVPALEMSKSEIGRIFGATA